MPENSKYGNRMMQPPPRREMSRGDAALRGVTSGATMGWGDELAGNMGGLTAHAINMLQDEYHYDPDEIAAAVRELNRRELAQARSDHPVTTIGSEFAGAVANPVARTRAGGMAIGAVSGAGEYNENRALGAGLGALAGGIVSPIGSNETRRIARIRTEEGDYLMRQRAGNLSNQLRREQNPSRLDNMAYNQGQVRNRLRGEADEAYGRANRWRREAFRESMGESGGGYLAGSQAMRAVRAHENIRQDLDGSAAQRRAVELRAQEIRREIEEMRRQQRVSRQRGSRRRR